MGHVPKSTIIFVGDFVEAACEALSDLRVRCSAPVSTAVCVAVERALRRASAAAISVAPAWSRRDDPSVMLRCRALIASS